MLKILFSSILVFVFILPVRAEMMGEVILGKMDIDNTSVSASYTCFLCSTESASREVNFEESSYAGVRYLFWGNSLSWLGGGFEIATFSADNGSTVDIDGMSFSAQGFLRKPLLVSAAYPYGRLQPYIGLGIFTFIGSAEVDFTPDISTRLDVEGDGTGMGVMAGLRWLVSERIALLLEARATKVKMSFDDDDFWGFNDGSAEAKLSSQYYLLGASIKF